MVQYTVRSSVLSKSSRDSLPREVLPPVYLARRRMGMGAILTDHEDDAHGYSAYHPPYYYHRDCCCCYLSSCVLHCMWCGVKGNPCERVSLDYGQ